MSEEVDPLIDRLAEAVGILPSYIDVHGETVVAGPDQKLAALDAMGYAVATETDRSATLKALDDARRRRLMPVVTVAREGQGPHRLALGFGPATAPAGPVEVAIELEDGTALDPISVAADQMELSRETAADGLVDIVGRVPLPQGLPLGYHRVTVTRGDCAGETTLIVAPRHCHLPGDGARPPRSWLLTTQLYSLRRDGDWGIGDFTALADLVDAAGSMGAAGVGLNPLHALFPADPAAFSPYSPSSRGFLNSLYIDVEAVPEFHASEAARAVMNETVFGVSLDTARVSDLVDYAAVAAAKRPVLEGLYRDFEEARARDPANPRATGLARFKEELGSDLESQAIFDALQEHFLAQDRGLWSWAQWPADFHDPSSPAVRAFAEAHADRVEFFQYLQWLADQQLAHAGAVGRARGMPIGLYRDFAVGVNPAGADAWANRTALVSNLAIGAPPDPLCIDGQNWGLCPFAPAALTAQAYRPFAAAVGANMRHAGALRIDHVMSLMRLFCIPNGMPTRDGVYLRYPFDDLLAVVALESERHRAIVVGEDLGTVPEGFRERMAAEGVLSYRVMMFERDGDGSFRQPASYPSSAAVTVSTHDLPTFSGYWTGHDLDIQEGLGAYASDADRDAAEATRGEDRSALMAALDRADLTGAGEDAGATSPTPTIPVHRFIAGTDSRLMLVQIEDALEVIEQANVPGTTDSHPNWRRRMPKTVAEFRDDPRAQDLAAAIVAARPSQNGKGSGSTEGLADD